MRTSVVSIVVVPLGGWALSGRTATVGLAAVRRGGVVSVVVVPATGRSRSLAPAAQTQLAHDAPPGLVPLYHWNVRSLTPRLNITLVSTVGPQCLCLCTIVAGRRTTVCLLVVCFGALKRDKAKYSNEKCTKVFLLGEITNTFLQTA